MAGYANQSPVTPLLLQGTSLINFKSAVPGSVGVIKDTLIYAFHILLNGAAVSVTLGGFLDNLGAPASIVWTGSTTVDTIISFPTPILNWGGAFTATPSVAGKVWLYLSPYTGGPV